MIQRSIFTNNTFSLYKKNLFSQKIYKLFGNFVLAYFLHVNQKKDYLVRLKITKGHVVKKSIKINFFLFFALFWVSLLAIINPVIAQTPLVTVERLLIPAGRGPFAEYASGQARTYLNNDTKAFKINIDGQTLSAPLIDGRLQLTVPKMMWFDVETGPNFIFSGENIVIRDWDRIIIDRTTDPNNYILSFPLKTIDPTTKGIVSFDFWTHDKQTVPTLFVFNTTVSIMDKDKNVLSTATMADPFILGNTATKFFVARARFISINNLVTDRRAIYAGAQLTEPNPPSRNYIDQTERNRSLMLPEYANGDTLAVNSRGHLPKERCGFPRQLTAV